MEISSDCVRYFLLQSFIVDVYLKTIRISISGSNENLTICFYRSLSEDEGELSWKYWHEAVNAEGERN